MNHNRRMLSRFAAFVIWAAIAASAVFWAMRLWVKPDAAPAHATVVSAASGFNGDLSRLFGPDTTPTVSEPVPGTPPAAQADARFRLIGVVAPRSSTARAEGLALIATDGKLPKAYRVGAVVDGDLLLQAVHARGASLGARGQAAQVNLDLPPLPPPTSGAAVATGGLPPPLRAGSVQPGRALPAPALPPALPTEAAPPPEPVDRSAGELPPPRPTPIPPATSGRMRQPV
ncbi:MAG: type II secretion system protein N [Rubrivivax sp.]